MSGGDAARLHNGVRDVYFDYCQRGGLRAESETPQLLQDILGPLDAHRPEPLPFHIRCLMDRVLFAQSGYALISGS